MVPVEGSDEPGSNWLRPMSACLEPQEQINSFNFVLRASIG